MVPFDAAGWMALTLFLIVYGIIFAFGIADYVLMSLGLYRMAKARGIPAPGLAWVPIGCYWLIGRISGDLKFGKFTLKNTKLWLVLAPVIAIGAMILIEIIMTIVIALAVIFSGGRVEILSTVFIPFILIFILIFIIALIAIELLFCMAYYQIFAQYKEPAHAVFYLILSLFVPLAAAILLFRVSRMSVLYPEVQD